MASIGYGRGFYSRSYYNNLAFQAVTSIAGVSGFTSPARRVKITTSIISGVSDFDSSAGFVNLAH